MRRRSAVRCFSDSPEALRFEAPINPGARGDQALADIAGGLLGGASLGFRAAYGGERRSADGIREISRARLLDVALVDRPSYRGSSIEVRSDRPAVPAFWWR